MRKIEFIYYLLDKNDHPKPPTSLSQSNRLNNVLDGDISYSSLGRLKSSLKVTIKDLDRLEIDYMNDRINPCVVIDGVETSLGIYLISSPSRNIKATGVTRDLTCYSKLALLDRDKVLNRYYIPAGANVVNAVITLLGSNPYHITPSEQTTRVDREWEVGTAKLDIINDLLDVINYTSLIPDRAGKFVAYPYKEPTEREIEIEYQSGTHSIISSDMNEEFDFFDVPNIFIRYTNHVDIHPPLIAVYPIQNGDEPITLDGNAPNVSSEEVIDISDEITLYDKCKKDAYESRSVYSHLNFTTAINPLHDYLSCIQVHVGDIHYKFIETSWSFKLQVGALMKHTCRRVVRLDGNQKNVGNRANSS